MTITIKPPKGNGAPVPVETTLVKKVNADGVLTFDILENKYTYEVINAIGKRWIVSHVEGENDKKEYVITVIDRKSEGDRQLVECTAREIPIDKLMIDRIYVNVTGSFTVERYFNIVFQGTGMLFEVEGKVKSSKFENGGEGDTRLEMLKKGLEHFGLEYKITYDKKKDRYKFVLTPFANQKASYFISDEVNANAIKLEEDASDFATFIRGYGNYSGEETFEHAGLVMEARSALAEIYGDIHAEPFKDGKVTDQETMDKELQSRLKKSLKQSLSLDFLVLRESYPEADPQPGDIVQIKSTKLGLNDLVRIVQVKTIRGINNVIVKQDVTLGEFNREQRYMKKVNTAANYVSGLNDVNLSNPSKAAENLKSKVASIAKSTLDLMSRTDLIEDKQQKVSSKTVTTSDGTIVHDFIDKSNIKDVKTIGTIGDSVARGSHAKTNFTEMLGKKLKAKTTNLARGGATMATVPIGKEAVENSIYRQTEQIRGDLIILQGTDDDWLHGYWAGVPIGTDKTDTKTFYGAFCSAIEVIRKNNPTSKILVMTATRQCPMSGTTIRRKDTDKNKLGLTLEDYVNAQILACSELDVPVYDAYHTDYFKPYNPAFRKSSMPDGLHPNERGHEVIMYELIKNYYQFYG